MFFSTIFTSVVFKTYLLPVMQSIIASWLYEKGQKIFSGSKNVDTVSFDESIEEALSRAIKKTSWLSENMDIHSESKYYKMALLSHLADMEPEDRLRYVNKDLFESFREELKKSPHALRHLTFELILKCKKQQQESLELLKDIGKITKETFENTERILEEQHKANDKLDRIGKSVDEILEIHDKATPHTLNQNEIHAIKTKTDELNQEFYFSMPKDTYMDLIPRILYSGRSMNVETLLNDNWELNTPHLFLMGDGGMGKTTLMLNYCKKSSLPVVYLSANYLMSKELTICNYCETFVFEGNQSKFNNYCLSKQDRASLLIIIDGLNEVDGTVENKIVQEIQKLTRYKGIQFIVTSRTDFTVRYPNLRGFVRADLLPLDEEVIKNYFTTNEWNSILKQPTLTILLSNPMMLTIYKMFCSIYEKYRNIEFLDWKLPVNNKSDLLHNYYVAQVALMMNRDDADGSQVMMAATIVEVILPALAYEYERNYCLTKSNEDFRIIIDSYLNQDVLRYEKSDTIKEYYRLKQVGKLDIDTVFDMLVSDLNLMGRLKGSTFFYHQIYRDYLSAQWIIRQTNKNKEIETIWNKRRLSFPVMEHIRNCSGKYWDGIAKIVHHAGVGRTDSSILIENMVDCFTIAPNAGMADYSELDLTNITLPDILEPNGKVSLSNAAISYKTLGISNDVQPIYYNLSFTRDCKYLAACSEATLFIFRLLDGVMVLRHEINSLISSIACGKDTVLVNANGLHVYRLHEDWEYKGALTSNNGQITRGLKKAIIVKDTLHLHYSNHLNSYSLEKCNLIEGCNDCLDKSSIVNGDDVTSIRRTIDLRRIREDDNMVVQEVSIQGINAISKRDGSLIVKNGDEVINVLVKGQATICDASISDDGGIVATLENTIVNEEKRIFLWNLNLRKRVGVLRCSQNVKNIYLSNNGKWIICVMDDKTIVYEVSSGNIVFETSDSFVSNRDGQLTTYEDNVLLRTRQSELVLYNIVSQQTCIVKKNSFPPKGLACFLRNGDVAVVDDKRILVNLPSERNGKLLELVPGLSSIKALHAFKNQPFIAVACTNNIVSIYHTGTGQRTRKLDSIVAAEIVSPHPSETILARSDGKRKIVIHEYYEKTIYGKKRGWWRDHSINNQNLNNSKILDLAFNVNGHHLVSVMKNGKLLFFNERDGSYNTSFQIITAFNPEAYDFSNVKCSNELRQIINWNI